VAKTAAAPQWQRALVVLTGTVVVAVVIVMLYWAHMVFIPLALALFLAFLLNPMVRGLQRRGLGRVPSLLVVLLRGALVLFGLGWLMVL
jgi:predicted PurR-regulated permease PerM